MFAKIALVFAVVIASASAFSAYAQSPRGGRSHAIHAAGQQMREDPNAVIFDGRKIGQDPDPAVRRELFRNAESGE